MPHFCRNQRCRSKLKDHPVDNPRCAFCCRGCYRQHYAKHCLACEQPAQGRRLYHQHPKCRAEYRTLKRHEMLGKYHDSGRVGVDARNPIKPGIKSRLKTWGPPLSNEQFRLATLGRKKAGQRKPHNAIPVNIIGGYRFPNARPVKLTIESDQAKVEAS
jgi:hypothetical protein